MIRQRWRIPKGPNYRTIWRIASEREPRRLDALDMPRGPMPDEPVDVDMDRDLDMRRALAVAETRCKTDRARDVWRSRLAGHDLHAIGRRIRLSRERVRQIVRQVEQEVRWYILARGTDADGEACGWVRMGRWIGDGYFWTVDHAARPRRTP